MAIIARILHVVGDLQAASDDEAFANLLRGLKHYRHRVVGTGSATQLSSKFRDFAEIVVLPRGVLAVPAFWRTLRAYRPNVVHTRGQIAAHWHAVSALTSTIKIHSEHQSLALPVASLAKIRRWRALIDHFVCSSRTLERQMVNDVDIEPGRVSQIFDGVPITGEPVQRTLGDKVVRIAIIDDTAELQGLEALLRGIAAQRAVVHACVPHHQVDRAGALARENGIDVRIEVDRELWSESTELARLLVCASRAGSAALILRAMSRAIPVVAVAANEYAELIVPGQTGEVVLDGHCKMLAMVITDYLQHPRKLAAHARAAQLRALQHFSVDAMLHRYDSLYRTLLLRRGISLVPSTASH